MTSCSADGLEVDCGSEQDDPTEPGACRPDKTDLSEWQWRSGGRIEENKTGGTKTTEPTAFCQRWINSSQSTR